jgi:hypothetical protein
MAKTVASGERRKIVFTFVPVRRSASSWPKKLWKKALSHR